jgi:outer membrane protein
MTRDESDVPTKTVANVVAAKPGLYLVGGLLLLSLAATALMGAATALVGQEVPTRLTLLEAINVAKENNPTFLSAENDQVAAEWGVREAVAAFLPTASANGSASYTEAGVQRIGTLDFGAQSTDWYSSSYSLSLNWTLNGNTIFGLPAARADKRATRARIDAASFNLEAMVAVQYMAALRARDGVQVAQRQLDRARQNLQIVRTRVSSGAAAGTDGKQAEVDLGRAEVGLIQAERQMREDRSLLGEQLGVALGEDVELASQFEIFEPSWDRDALMDEALSAHPSLHAFRAQEAASQATARQAASQYFPTLSITTGFRGNTLQALNEDFIRRSVISNAEGKRSNCEFMNTLHSGLAQGLPNYEMQNCGAFAASDELIQSALNQNAAFPFDFTKVPISLSLQVSIPIFTGFSRQRQVSQAYNLAEDAQHGRRAEELRLRTAVTQAYDNLAAAYRIVQLEERNQAVAEEQLQLQQRRYALGAAALLELLDAQTTVSTADQAYLNALYDFHWNLIRLEASVGRILRPL